MPGDGNEAVRAKQISDDQQALSGDEKDGKLGIEPDERETLDEKDSKDE